MHDPELSFICKVPDLTEGDVFTGSGSQDTGVFGEPSSADHMHACLAPR